MLLLLSEWLTNYLHGFHVFQYLTLRAILSTFNLTFTVHVVRSRLLSDSLIRIIWGKLYVMMGRRRIY